MIAITALATQSLKASELLDSAILLLLGELAQSAVTVLNSA